MKYKVGDKVKIRKDLRNVFDCTPNMNKWAGQVMTIIKVEQRLGSYTMKEDHGEGPLREDGNRHWYWDDEMISGICNPKSIVYEVLV